MSTEHLNVYLNDHLAGSVAAIELLSRIQEFYGADPSAGVIAALKTEVESDQHQLESLMDVLHIRKSASRQAVGWLSEKLTAAKLRLDDMSDGALRLLESIEVAAIGIHGKLGLWNALAAAASHNAALRQLDYARLAERAHGQHQTVETLRIAAAEQAFAP